MIICLQEVEALSPAKTDHAADIVADRKPADRYGEDVFLLYVRVHVNFTVYTLCYILERKEL